MQEFFYALDVGEDVHACGVVHGFYYVHVEAVFQPAELFELFDAFEFTGGERGKFQQRVAAIAVEADVFPVAGGDAVTGLANPRDGAREK